MAPRAPVSPVEAACILLVRHTQHGHAVVHDASQDDCSRRTLSHSTCHKCTCMDDVTRPCAVPNSIHERALSKGDLVYTDDDTRTTRGMGGSNTLYERVGLLHATSARPGVGRARWLLKTARTASASCHGSGDPVGCRPCLSRRRVRPRASCRVACRMTPTEEQPHDGATAQ
jgi:hypothetical protein